VSGPNGSSFSTWLAVQLRERRLDVREFCRLSGVRRKTSERWLSGATTPRLISARSIARALSVPVNDVAVAIRSAAGLVCARCLWEAGESGGNAESAHTGSAACGVV
jgi:transcriptional regulator with XRE-family HTH domain